MSKKFRCGRLLLTRDGRIKKVDLGNGGGTRTCEWSDDHMNFDDVHNQLLTVFSFSDKKHETSLYDFQRQPLDVKQFQTFADYINKYGLNRNSTVVYLCTSEVVNEIPRRVEMDNVLPVVVKNEPEPIPVIHRRSSSEYSFIDASQNLMKNIRELINQSPSNKILLRLFENLCSIHGHVFSIILPLQQLNEQSNESEKTLYLHNLDNIYEIFESTKSLLHRNLDHFRHMRLFSTIRSAFFQFHNNIKILRNRWMKTEENNNQTNTSSISSDIKSTPPPPTKNALQSSSRRSLRIKNERNIRFFKSLSSTLNYLLRLTKTRNLSSFQTSIFHAIEKVKVLQNTLNLSDETSICNAKQVLLVIKSQLNQNYRELDNDSTKSQSDRTFRRIRLATIRVIRSTLTSLYRKQITHENQQITSKS